MSWLRRFLHIEIPAEVSEDAITVPSFTVPVTDIPAPCIEGTIAVEVEPESKMARGKVALKKKPVRKKVAAKKRATKK